MEKDKLNKEELTILVIDAVDEIINSIRCERCKVDTKLEDHFYGDLYFDSLDRVDLEGILVDKIYERIGEELNPPIFEEFWIDDPTVQDLVNYLAKKLSIQ